MNRKYTKTEFSRYLDELCDSDTIALLKQKGFPTPIITKDVYRYGAYLYRNCGERFNALYAIWVNGNFVKEDLFKTYGELRNSILAQCTDLRNKIATLSEIESIIESTIKGNGMYGEV